MQKFIEFDSPNGTLRGTVHIPDGPPPHPGVVIMHGFTGQRMESGFIFVGLSRAMDAAGLAVVEAGVDLVRNPPDAPR